MDTVNSTFHAEILESRELDISEAVHHPKLLKILDWWRSYGGCPGFKDVDPVAFPPRALQFITVLNYTDEDTFQVRLAGTNLCGLLGRELKGEEAVNAFTPDSITQLERPFRLALDRLQPTLFRRRMTAIHSEEQVYDLLTVPLLDDNGSSGVLLCASYPTKINNRARR